MATCWHCPNEAHPGWIICDTCNGDWAAVLERKDPRKPVYGSHERHQSIERQVHRKDILQPLKKDGTINKDFVQVHGTSAIEKNYKLTKQQIQRELE